MAGGDPCEGKGGSSSPSTNTEWTTDGRFIEERVKGEAPHHFFVKGVAYSPTPIGGFVTDPPACNSPLRNSNKPIWSRDLPMMQMMGVNVIHVYNVTPPPWADGPEAHVGTINEFLDAAWNNGKNPIFVIMSIHFASSKLLDEGAVNSLVNQYYELDKKYAKYPAVMGVAISNEIIGNDVWDNKAWWDNFNRVAVSAKRGFEDQGAKKLVMTSDYDGLTKIDFKGIQQIAQIYYGEKYHAAVDVWGDNTFRGRSFTEHPNNLFTQVRDTTDKPVIFTEYGASAAYHTAEANTYSYPKGNPDKNGVCDPLKPTSLPLTRDVKELPNDAGANPNMAGLVDYVKNSAELLYKGYQTDGVVSGGTYLEWTDEWWKADVNDWGFRSKHVGDLNFTNYWPGCARDEAWYGLNAITKGRGSVDALTARTTRGALKQIWATER
ncbi:MAG: hypothetical protein JO190_06680 [Candidatus Eremiobacteraeota bacterium]|nr:hypothetical protein [Candidatus Eremiobacteraeota bacterium]MBV8498376.1 hypothetical protein [Candidatus Eremiobacteraeota bacterium]